jgi:hypothetical protein
MSMQELTVWPKEKRLRNNVSNDLHCEIKKKKGKSNIIDLTLAPSVSHVDFFPAFVIAPSL